MEISVNLQLADRVEQYEIDLIDIIAAYKTAKKEYFKDIVNIEVESLNTVTFLVLRGLIDEQVSISEEQEVVSWIDDENLATLRAYVAKVVHVLEL